MISILYTIYLLINTGLSFSINQMHATNIHNKPQPLQLERNPNVNESTQLVQNQDMKLPICLQTGRPIRQPAEPEPDHNMRRSVQLEPTHDMKYRVQFEPVRRRRGQVHLEPNHDTRRLLHLQSTNNTRKPVHFEPTQDTRRPAEFQSTHNGRRQDPLESYHDMGRNLIQIKPTEGEPAHLETTHASEKPIGLELSRYIRKPVHLDSARNAKRPLRVELTHGMRKPIRLQRTHNRRRPVRVGPTHNMRNSVQLEPTHNERQSVQLEPSNNMRRPVALEESHDLRWPVLEEDSHDSRIPKVIKDLDLFRSEFLDINMGNMLKSYKSEEFRQNIIGNDSYDAIYEMLQEDEFLNLKCMQSGYDSSDDERFRNVSEQNSIFKDLSETCGKTFNETINGNKSRIEWPWTVSIQQYVSDRFKHVCGGSLLNNLWVITAAHCVEMQPKWDFILQLGNYNIHKSESHENHPVERFLDKIVIHPQFNNLNLENDIALLRMESPVEFQSNVAAICLPWSVGEVEENVARVLSRRPVAEESVFSQEQFEVLSVPVLSSRECKLRYSKTTCREDISDIFLCSGTNEEGFDVYEGDSGGPLVLSDLEGRWSVIGLVSWGKSCTEPKRPGVYTRVTRYLEWMQDTIDCYENSS